MSALLFNPTGVNVNSKTRFLIAMSFSAALLLAVPAFAQGKAAEKKAAPAKPMHAVLVTFESDAASDAAKLNDFLKALKKVPGLVMKTWVAEGATAGGIYVFSDKESADAYLAGDLFQGAAGKNPSVRNLQFRHFDVNGELSAKTGTPMRLLSTVK